MEARERTEAMVSAPVTVEDFRRDPMFPRVERAVAAILASGKVVAPVDVLLKMDILAPKDLEDWRFGRVPYLERASLVLGEPHEPEQSQERLVCLGGRAAGRLASQ